MATAGRDTVEVYVRKHSFTVGAPIQFDPEYAHISALEYALGAVAADVVNGLRALARKRRTDLDAVEALVSGELNNPLTYLGVVGETGHPGIDRAAITVYLCSEASEDEIQKLWEENLERSPLVRTFKAAIGLEVNLKISM